MRPVGSAEVLEERRRLAIQMLEDGLRPAEIARRLHVSRQSVSRWQHAYQRKGLSGIKATPHPGPKPKLNRVQRRRLHRLLLKGALEFGYSTDLWTRQRVAEVIEREYGVHYHTDHISRLLMGMGWTCQKPEKRAKERNEEAIQTWIHKDWPRIKKKAARTGATICFIDQTGISEIPNVRRSWAPRGQTPILRHRGHWNHVSVMGGITISPRRRHVNLYLAYYPRRAVNRLDVIVFLQGLMRHTFRPIILIADRGNIHRAREVKAFIAKNRRLTLEHLPSYAPELNPMEGVWSNLKAAKLANFCPDTLDALLEGSEEAATEIQQDRRLIKGFIRGTGLPIRL